MIIPSAFCLLPPDTSMRNELTITRTQADNYTATVAAPFRVGIVNTCTPAPASSPSSLVCIAGTDAGILQHDRERGLRWLLPPANRAHQHHHHRQNDDPHRAAAAAAARGETLSLDFLTGNVILCGGRAPDIGLLDLRAPADEWTALRHASAAAHVRAVGPHDVLAAGPRSAMAVYDVRYMRPRLRQDKDRNGTATAPVVRFPAYRNQAHIHIGLDVLVGHPGYGAGLAAAAHDDGRVVVYSLRDGTRLASPTVDAIDVGDDGDGGVVKSLMFSTLPPLSGDGGHPSLFVGERAVINKYSFGRAMADGDDWWC